MSINTIVKSDGTVVAFEPEKLHKWASFASDNEVEWSSIVLDAYKKCYDGCSTKDIQQAMISACVEREDEKHLRMAGRLLLGGIYKEAHGGYNSIPTLKDFFHSMINRGLWTEMDYSDEELDKLESVIDHSKNLSKNYSYTALKQMRDKYMNQDLISRKCFESPQFMFMGVALNSMENQPKETRLDNVARTYEYLSDLKINLSTPMLVNLRTPKKGLASCCVYTTKDTAESLATGDHIAYMMTCASAGIGSHLTTRSIGDPVRNGAVIHQGKLPYLRMIQSAVHANKQACYDDKTKVLTNTGFKLFKDLNDDDLVAQVHDDGTIDFVEPIEGFVYDFKGNLVNFKLDENVQLPVTPNHTMVYSDLRTETVTSEQASLDSNIQFKTSRADEIVIENGIAFKVSGHTKNRDSINLHNLDLLMGVLLTQPVDYFENGISIKVNDNNRDTIEKLCEALELDFNGVSIDIDDNSKTLNYTLNGAENFIKGRMETFLTRVSTMMITEFVDFLRYISIDKNIRYYNDKCKEYLQSILAISGKYFTTNTINENGKITILDDVTSHIDATAFEVEEFEYDGKVYCLQVPTNKLIVQREDLTLICGNSRGGANTTYFSVLDPEINDLIALKNPTTIQQKRIRDIDYAMNVNKLFVEKVARNEEWFTISYHYAKDLHDAFYSSDYELFKMLYENYKDHEHAVHYKARDIALKALTESVETGRLYIHYVDEANRHTPFAVGSGADDDKIYSSNLCLEISLITKGYPNIQDLYSEEISPSSGEIGLCSLSSIVMGRVSEEEYEDVAYHTLLLVDNTLEIMDYPFPSLRSTARKRRNIGIGMTNLAYDIASRGLSYTTQEGKEYIHKVAERHAYYLYKGSLRLAKEKGNAEWMHKTKYPQGWLPIDTYNKNVDSVVENNLTYDWETLRKDIIKQGGIRNSTVTAIPPNESSSLLTNTTNSIYPIRSLRVIKTSGTNRNILLAPDYETLKDKYDIAWNMKSKDLIELYAIVQKFTDQGISSDLYVTYKDSQLVSSRDLLSDFILMAKLGCKSRYYINSQSGVDIKETEVIDTSGQCEACVL